MAKITLKIPVSASWSWSGSPSNSNQLVLVTHPTPPKKIIKICPQVKTTTANLGESRYQIWAGARSENSIRAHAPSADTPLASLSYSAINLTTIYRQVQIALTEYVIRRIALLNSCKYVIYIQYHTQSVTVSTDFFLPRAKLECGTLYDGPTNYFSVS